MKKCSDCGIEKPLDEFPKHKQTRDGHRGQCKACKQIYERERYKDKTAFKAKKYKRGENNGNSKLSNKDIELMFNYHDSLSDDLDRVESEIDKLNQKRKQIKKQMQKTYIADMFEVDRNTVFRIFRGELRNRNCDIVDDLLAS
jgi:hypothetical protein